MQSIVIHFSFIHFGRSKDQSPSTPSAERPADQEVRPTNCEPSDEVHASSEDVDGLQPEDDGGGGGGELTKLIGNDECDISDFPLPELPVSSRQDPTSSDSFLTATDAEDGGVGLVDESLESEQRNRERTGDTDVERPLTQQDELDSMHYRTAANGGKPTYLFGENVKKNGIFLNKSGWVQVTGTQQTIPGRGVPGSYPIPGNERTGASGMPTGPPTATGSKVTRKYIEYDENRYTGRSGTGASKLEDLINRNESRGKGGGTRPSSQQQRQDNVTILKIDPGSGTTSTASLGNRPACLSIKRNLADGSPPPVTPILSPPPAFQDTQQQQQQQQQQSNKTRLGDIKPGTRIFLSVVDNENHNPKGMVFSRSFEYDRRNRRPPEEETDQRGGYGGLSTGPGSSSSTDAFSKSFDYDFNPTGSMGSLPQQQQPKQQPQQQQPLKSSLIRRNRSPTFATLTGNSPNYLTKKEKPAKLSSPIFPKAIPGNSLTVNRATLGYASSESLRKFDKNKSLDAGGSMGSGAFSAGHRSRRSQFSTKANSAPGLPYGFRSDSVGNQRLNSCDSGARSDYSNDDVDDDDDISEDQSSSLALSYKSSTSYINQMKGRASFTGGSPSQSQSALLSAGSPHGLLKSQRSLTPERLYDNNDEYGSARNLKKQRSLTPEKRSRTPDDRSKRKGAGDQGNNSSQSSLVSRQSSGSRSSTLERQQLRYDEGYMRTSSRSSSSSSYSRDENVPTTSPSATYRRNQLRGNVRLQPGSTTAIGGDYKIRRSRSLQLSERSPSRQQMPVQQMPHKVVVRLGTVPPKERPTYATPNVMSGGRKQGPTTAQLLSQDSLNLGGGGHIYSRISPSSTLDRLRRETASHNLEVVDKSKSFDNNNYGLGLGATGVTHPYEYEFDKSKSFDDNLGMPLADRMSDKRTYVTNEKRSYSHDRVFGSTGTNSSSNEYATSQSSTSRNRSPQTSLFGGLNRLYEPELPYELNRVTMARSPVMMGSAYRQTRTAVSRERSPVPGYQKPSDLYLMRQQTPDSEYDDRLMTPEYGAESGPVQPIATFKEAELVKKFLYATKNKVQMHRESAARNAMPPPTIAGTPSSGSCTASSCDFWPHCGVSSAGATASALQVEEHSKEQNAQHLSKSGSDNCLSRKVKRAVVPAEVIYIGAAEDGGAGGPRGDGGGNSSSNSSNGSHISSSNTNGSAIMWPNTSTAK
uniref:Uncharacterized protein n=1 Tax=Anopheles culicifacies TaxID=139723 RepID=A0A182M080_9DIPT